MDAPRLCLLPGTIEIPIVRSYVGNWNPALGVHFILPNCVHWITLCRMTTLTFVKRDTRLTREEITDAETGAMLRAFFNLVEHWALNDRRGGFCWVDWQRGPTRAGKLVRLNRRESPAIQGNVFP